MLSTDVDMWNGYWQAPRTEENCLEYDFVENKPVITEPRVYVLDAGKEQSRSVRYLDMQLSMLRRRHSIVLTICVIANVLKCCL